MTDFREIKHLFEITENKGFSQKEINESQKVCENIPKVLIDYYSQLGKIKKLNQAQNNLILPAELNLSKNEDFLIFYIENQRVCVWGINKNDLKIDNPPVYMSYDENKWCKETNSLTDFLKAMANLQAVFSLSFCSEGFLTLNNEELKKLETNFKKREVSFSKWIGINFYGNHENDVIVVQEDYYLSYASNNKQQFNEMNEVLNNSGQ